MFAQLLQILSTIIEFEIQILKILSSKEIDEKEHIYGLSRIASPPFKGLGTSFHSCGFQRRYNGSLNTRSLNMDNNGAEKSLL